MTFRIPEPPQDQRIIEPARPEGNGHCLSASLAAMMPPHVTHTLPNDGAELAGDTIEVHGWTFAQFDDEPITVTGPDGTSAPFTSAFEGGWRGEGEQPGAQQLRSILRIRLTTPEPGPYRVRFLDADFTVRVPR
jgi:hypothetical protein